MDNEAVLVQDLVKRYGNVTAVNGVSFSVRKGEVFGLLGPNGAGKTTTLECLEGIRIPDNGQMKVAGSDPCTDLRDMRKKLGVQLQSSSLPDTMRTDEAMALICAWHGQAPRFDLLTRFGLELCCRRPYSCLP